MRLARAAAGLAIALAVALLPACARRGPRAAARPSVVALVGELPVEDADFAVYVKGAGAEEKGLSARVGSSLLDQFLEDVLLDRLASTLTPAPNATLADRRKALVEQRAGLDAITDDELRREYAAHAERYAQPSAARVSQLLFRSRADAEAARAKLARGTPWLEVSSTSSAAPNAATGGALGLVSTGDLPRAFEPAVFALKPGQTTSILEAPYGFHIFRVEERYDGRPLPFEDARAALRLAVAERRSTEARAELLAEARKRFPVKIVEEHLPFPYVGSEARFAADNP